MVNDWSDYHTSSDVIDDDRGMGSEIEHSYECEEYECPNTECKKSFKVLGSIYEYPEGSINTVEFRAE